MTPDDQTSPSEDRKVIVSNGSAMPVPVKLEPDPTVHIGNFQDLLDLRQTYPIVHNRQAFEYRVFRSSDELTAAAGVPGQSTIEPVLTWLGDQGYETSFEMLSVIMGAIPSRQAFPMPIIFRRIK